MLTEYHIFPKHSRHQQILTSKEHTLQEDNRCRLCEKIFALLETEKSNSRLRVNYSFSTRQPTALIN